MLLTQSSVQRDERPQSRIYQTWNIQRYSQILISELRNAANVRKLTASTAHVNQRITNGSRHET